jgi:hypothetical protein
MGYRSDVAAVLYVTNKDDFPVLKLWLDQNFPVKEFEDHIRWFDRGIVLECDNTKWYDDYPEIKKFNNAAQAFIDLFCAGEEEVPEGAYEFMRIGEEYEDIESIWEGAYDYFLNCNRSISIGV